MVISFLFGIAFIFILIGLMNQNHTRKELLIRNVDKLTKFITKHPQVSADELICWPLPLSKFSDHVC